MEELREIAKAYYDSVSVDIKQDVQNIFNEMDSNSDGKVRLPAFLNFMRQERYTKFKSSDLFNHLCQGNREYLEFMDVVTLYYIILSGRPFCDCCGQFIKDIYFCCIHCFQSTKRNYYLCTPCFKGKKYITGPTHTHQFVDNFTLLEFIKRIIPSKGELASIQDNHGNTSLALVPVLAADSTSRTPDPPESPPKPKKKGIGRYFKRAYKGFEKALILGNIAFNCLSA